MKYLDEFRDPALAEWLLKEIRAAVTRPWAIMEASTSSCPMASSSSTAPAAPSA